MSNIDLIKNKARNRIKFFFEKRIKHAFPAVIKEFEGQTNLYHDFEDSQNPDTEDVVMYISVDPPLKVVKKLGWWKEGESLPMIAYLPYYEGWTPKENDRFEVGSDQNYMSGKYRIKMVKSGGHKNPIYWVLNIVPDRIN